MVATVGAQTFLSFFPRKHCPPEQQPLRLLDTGSQSVWIPRLMALPIIVGAFGYDVIHSLW
jgi:hypothetical protein